ncbi:hypothetical protein ABH926_007754 [Catenulispora sp. GP43]|uniref:ATP-binding protein n=1 Tax=Catenulispora sp. GP43 TaxID=3156263 RepID=UPI0035121122
MSTIAHREPPRVLLINSGKAEALDRLLATLPDAEVDVLTEASYAKQYKAGTRLHFVQDIGDLTEVKRAALGILGAHRIDAVVGPSERSQQAAGYLRSYLGLPGIGYETANRFSNKAVMKRELTRAGIPVADHRVVVGLAGVAAAAEEIGWPVVVKPALGTGSMNTFAPRSAAEWEALLASGSCAGLAKGDCPLLVERFVEMEGEYHCDGVVRDGRVEFVAVSRYFMPLLGGTDAFTGSYILPEENRDADILRALHERAVAALGLSEGVTHFEAFKTAGGFVAGEIACRPAGGGIVEAIILQFGVDLWDAYMRSALGLPVALPAPVRRTRPDIIVNCDLPIRPGKVVRVSSAQELAGLPDVVRVTMGTAAGDVIGTRLHSASTTGLVYLAVAEEQQVATRVAELSAAYVLQTEPVAD